MAARGYVVTLTPSTDGLWAALAPGEGHPLSNTQNHTISHRQTSKKHHLILDQWLGALTL